MIFQKNVWSCMDFCMDSTTQHGIILWTRKKKALEFHSLNFFDVQEQL